MATDAIDREYFEQAEELQGEQLRDQIERWRKETAKLLGPSEKGRTGELLPDAA